MIAVVAAMTGVFAPITADATSCMRMQERFYVACRSGHCESQFRWVPEKANHLCGRRHEVRTVDDRVGSLMAELVEQQHPDGAEGVYALSVAHRYFPYLASKGFEDFGEGIDHLTNMPGEQPDARRWVELDHARQLAALRAVVERNGMELVSIHSTGSEIASLRSSLELEQRTQLRESRMQWLGVLLVAILGVAATVQTTRMFFLAIRVSAAHGQPVTGTTWPLTLQLGLLVTGFLVAGRADAWSGIAMTIPLLVVILFVECLAMPTITSKPRSRP